MAVDSEDGGEQEHASHEAEIAHPTQIPVRPHRAPPKADPATSTEVPIAMILEPWAIRCWARQIDT